MPAAALPRWSQVVVATLYLGWRRGKRGLWGVWGGGKPLKAFGRGFGKPSSSIYFQVAPYGGIRPAPRHRSRLALTLSEREEISRGIAAAPSMPPLASVL